MSPYLAAGRSAANHVFCSAACMFHWIFVCLFVFLYCYSAEIPYKPLSYQCNLTSGVQKDCKQADGGTHPASAWMMGLLNILSGVTREATASITSQMNLHLLCTYIFNLSFYIISVCTGLFGAALLRSYEK